MCAAPGSKTAQIHDLVFGKRANESMLPFLIHLSCSNCNVVPTGCIVANDSNYQRCLLLSQRLSKTSSPHLLVTNHDAQHFPLKSGTHARFFFHSIVQVINLFMKAECGWGLIGCCAMCHAVVTELYENNHPKFGQTGLRKVLSLSIRFRYICKYMTNI